MTRDLRPTGTDDGAEPTPSADAGPLGAVVVVTGGDAFDPALAAAALASLPPDVAVIAADSGAQHALEAGLSISHLVGDFDSLPTATLDRLAAGGTRIERHPVEKDATDLELALDAAEALGARRVLVLGGHGGRLDHFLANALVLGSPRFANLVVSAVMGEARVHVARPWAVTELPGRPGDLVTLLAMHGPAEGVQTEGLLYPLDRDTLIEGSTRGVSNEMVGDTAVVRLTAGCLLVVQPGAAGTHLREAIRLP